MPDKAAATMNAQVTGFTLGEDSLPDLMHVSVFDQDKELWEVGRIPLEGKKRTLMKKLGEATKEKLLESPIIVLVNSNGWASDGYNLVNPILSEAKPGIKEPDTINFSEIPKFKVAVSETSGDNTVETPETVAEKPKRQRKAKADTPTPAEPSVEEAEALGATLGIEEPQGEKCPDCDGGRVPGGPNAGQTMACLNCAGEGFIKPKASSADPAEEEPVSETPEAPDVCPDCGGSRRQSVPGGKLNQTMACLTCAETPEAPAAEPVAETPKEVKPKRQRKAKPAEAPAAEPVAETPKEVKPKRQRKAKPAEEPAAPVAEAPAKKTKASGQTRQANMKTLLEGKVWKIQEEGWTEEGLTSTSGFHLKHWYRIVVEETGETAVVGRGELIEYASIKPPRKKRTTTVTTAKAGFRSFFADADGPVGKAGEIPEISIRLSSELEIDGLTAVAEAAGELPEEPTFDSPSEEPAEPVSETQEEPVKSKRQRRAKATHSEEPAEPVAETQEEPAAPVAESPKKETKPKRQRKATPAAEEPAAPVAETPAEESGDAIDLEQLIRSAEESASDGVDVEDLLNPSEGALTGSTEEEGDQEPVDLSFVDGLIN